MTALYVDEGTGARIINLDRVIDIFPIFHDEGESPGLCFCTDNGQEHVVYLDTDQIYGDFFSFDRTERELEDFALPKLNDILWQIAVVTKEKGCLLLKRDDDKRCGYGVTPQVAW